MEQTWRWFGPSDPVSLADIRQAGATGVVTALHHLPNGAIWNLEDIERRKNEIEKAGLRWSVVESIPVHEKIKRGEKGRDELIANYQVSLRHLGRAGIPVVCYNFMPLLDWTRTDLDYVVDDGSEALRFDAVAFAAFELFLLRRPEAEANYSPAAVRHAEEFYDKLSPADRSLLTKNILAGLPGSEESFDLTDFQKSLDTYRDIDAESLRTNLVYFLERVIPVATQAGVRMAIHPDDPPRPLLGLPRVVSTEDDIESILGCVDSSHNGLTFCTGSLGVRPDNNLLAMFRRFGDRIHFLHLRSTKRESAPGGFHLESFHEANHLEGDVDMFSVVREVLSEERKRNAAGRPDWNIPMRPDHGHRMLDDLRKKVNPGYSAIGRLRGLAELRGLAMGIDPGRKR